MGNRTLKTPLKYNISYYEVDLVTFEINKVAHAFKDLDKESKDKMLKRWLK